MYIDILKNKVLKNKFSISYKNGEKLFKNGNVKFIDSKEIEGVANIYGRVNDGPRDYSTHIKINNKNNYYDLKCSCNLSREARLSGGKFACEHIIATILSLVNNDDVSTFKRKKERINITLRLEESFNPDYIFKAVLYLGTIGRIKISNKSELNFNVFSEEGSYSFKNIEYSKDEKRLLKLLLKMDFKIRDSELRNFLFISRDINLQIKISSSEYEGRIILNPLPLKFTLRYDNNKIRLQGTKTPIKALNTEKTVFLFNREIYIPPFKQCNAYSTIYDALIKKHYTYIKESALDRVIKILSSIGELNINDDIRELIVSKEEINLYFYKKNSHIYCKFKIDINKKYLKTSLKIKSIEEILFNNKFTRKDEEYLFVGEDKELLNLLKSNIHNYCNITSSKELKELKLLSMDDIKGNVESIDSNLKFNLNINDIDSEEFILAINEFKNGNSFYKFSNYSFLDFSNNKISEFMNFLCFINYKGEELNLPNGYEELFSEEIKNIKFINIIDKNKNSSEGLISPPKELKATLRDYQIEGLSWLQNKKEQGLFGILADEMGLGKTIQAISFLLLNKSGVSIVITQTSLIYNWLEEFNKFAPSLKVACIHGNKSKRSKLLENIKDYDVILTSYGTLNMDIEYYKNINFENLIIDEAQNIKNSKAKITKNIKSINGNFRLALTGTPIENNLMELWSIFDFLKPGYLFSEHDFKLKFRRVDDKNLNYLKLIIKPFILRRTKKEVLTELLDKNQWTFYISMTDEQKRYYKSSLKKYSKEIKDTNNHISVLAILTKLRQIALDPSILDENYTGGSGKINATLTLINKSLEGNKKTLIFSQFTSLLYKLREHLDNLNIEYYYLDGSTKAIDRINLCNEFNKSNKVKVFLISLKAGGTGLNLTSAEKVIHFDPWWNPAVENQATDRAHRIGQKNEVEVIKIISKGTIEEKILKLKEGKDRMISTLLSQGGSYKETYLTKEELDYILSFDE